MPRHTDPLIRRLAPVKRAAATAGLTAAALVVGVGGYAVATSPTLAQAPADRLALTGLLGGSDDVAAAGDGDPAAARDAAPQASRSERGPRGLALAATHGEASRLVAEKAAGRRYTQQATAQLAAEQEAARVAAEAEAARVAADAEAALAAAEEKAAAELAAIEAAQEQAAAEAAAEQEAEAAEAEQAAAEAAAAEEAAAVEQSAPVEQAAPVAPVAPADPGTNRAIAQSLLPAYGFGGDQWSCLDNLWQKESGWNHLAENPSSGAYGIPQSLPGNKMSSVSSDWRTNPDTQIRWGLGYIQGRYGTPCAAWGHSQQNNWY